MPVPAETIPEWENRTLGQIFRVTLNPEERTDSNNHKLIFLGNHRQELADENVPVLLTRDRLDGIILEAASYLPHDRSILDYLLPCWKRVIKALKSLKGYAGEKDVVLKEAKRLCMSYIIFAVEVPDLFGYTAQDS